MARWTLACAAILLVSLACAGGGQSKVAPEAAAVILYFHLNGMQEFPINTQEPDDSYSASFGYGMATTTMSCVPDPTGTTTIPGEYHTFYGYLSPSYVEYDDVEDGQPRIHQERGIARDIAFEGGFDLHWFMETQTALADESNRAPVVVPDVVVRATIRSGDGISVGNELYNEGELVAQGQAGPVTLAGPATTQPGQGEVTYESTAEGHHLYGFRVPMDLASSSIQREDGGNLRIDVFVPNPLCADPEGGYFMPNAVRLHTSPGHRPRMEPTIVEPVRIDYFQPQVLPNGTYVFHVEANSVFGPNDIGNITLTIYGPSPAEPKLVATVKESHCHCYPEPAPQWTWVWDPEGAEPGNYTATVTATNLQGTGFAERQTSFTLDGDKAAPGAGFGLAVTALAAVAFVRRRS